MIRRLMPGVFLSTVILSLGGSTPAQVAGGRGPMGRPAILPKPVPQLMVIDGEKSMPLDLAKVEIRTLIDGYVAETTEILTFSNPFPRILEGELEFPLPQGASISGFGLDMDGAMVEGVPVPKQEARITFEKEERQRVDPGLAEQTAGNVFRTRVYPIRPNSTRTIEVRYVEDLTSVAPSDGAFSYRLPVRFGRQVGQFLFHLDAVHIPAEPQIRGIPLAMILRHANDHYTGDAAMPAANFDADLVLALAAPPGQASVVERRTHRVPSVADLQKNIDHPEVVTTLENPEFYFAIHDLPPAEPVRDQKSAPIARLGICWDVSINRADSDKTRELNVLQAILDSLKPAEVSLIPFSNTLQPTQTFKSAPGDYSGLIEAIRALTYDGGLNMSCLRLAAHAPVNRDPGADHPDAGKAAIADEFLLFSSGMVNIGPALPRLMDAPVYPITSEARADYSVLNQIAAESGGQFFNLPRMTDDQVVSELSTSQPYSLLRVETASGELADVLPRGHVPAMGCVAVAGKLLSPTATLVLHYGIGNRETQSVTYHLARDDAADTGIIPRLWAQMELADLQLNSEQNAEVISDLGRQFNLVTSNTSLLVLENLQQYVTYDIVPPTSRADIYQQFVSQLRDHQATAKQTREQRIDQVVAEWNQRVRWWDEEFKAPAINKDRAGDAPDAAGIQDALPGAVASDDAMRFGARDAAGPQGDGSNGAGQANGGGAAGGPALSVPPARNSPSAGGRRGGRGGAGGRGAAAPSPQSNMALRSNAEMAAKGADSENSTAGGASVALKPWNPQTPYLTAIKASNDDQAYATYLRQRPDYAGAPSFFLDCSDYLIEHGRRNLGIRVLSNIPALKVESPELLRITASRLRQIGEFDLAVDLFEKALHLRPEEPQSYRDLGLALADRARAAIKDTDISKADAFALDKIAADYSRALNLLYQTVVRPQDQRFPWLEVIALEEANQILNETEPLRRLRPIANPLDPRLRKLLDLDVRVVMQWDTADTDIDLWVTEPTGEKCLYNHNLTRIGGMISNDFTQGYGPEEYNLHHAIPGKYLINANFYGSHATSLTGPTTIHLTIITRWGRPDETRQSLTVRMASQKEVVEIGTVTIEP